MTASVESNVTDKAQAQSLLYARDLNRLYLQERAQRRALEAAHRRLSEEYASRHAFVAVISHELRTPLVSVWAFLEILQEELADKLDPGQREFLDIAYRKTSDLVRVVRELTEFASLEDNRQWPVRRDGLDLASLADRVLAEFMPLAEANQISLVSEITGSEPILIGWQELHLILYHLISNAIKFTPPGGQVWVRGGLEDNHLIVQVSDTGIGIPLEVQQAIFRPFYQVEDHLTRAHGGLGLGLTLVERAVGVLNGTVTVQSELGRGSTFTVRLPYHAPNSMQATIERLSGELDRLQSQSLRLAQDFRQVYRAQRLTAEELASVRSQIRQYAKAPGPTNESNPDQAEVGDQGLKSSQECSENDDM